jgi:hypothetical protein
MQKDGTDEASTGGRIARRQLLPDRRRVWTIIYFITRGEEEEEEEEEKEKKNRKKNCDKQTSESE